MGYNSRIYVVRKMNHSLVEGSKLHYSEVMAIYEMRVFPPFQKMFDKHCPIANYAFYANDGNTLVVKDDYGEYLRERSLSDVIECLERVIAVDDEDAHNARIRPLLALLQEYQKIQNEWYQLSVLHYRH